MSSWELALFIQLTLCWAERRIYCIYQPNLPSPFSPRWWGYAKPVSVVRLVRQKPVFWVDPSEKLGCWMHKPTPSFPLEKLGAKGFLLDHIVVLWTGTPVGRGLKFFYSLQWVWFVFALGTGDFQLVSELLTTSICKLLLNWCLYGKDKSKPSHFTILLMSHPL